MIFGNVYMMNTQGELNKFSDFDSYFYDFDSYFYDFGHTLKNKLNIHNEIELEQVSNEYAVAGMMDLISEQLPNTFDSSYIKHIHKVLFGDVYDWAGEFRTCKMSRNQDYCDPEKISSEIDRFCEDFNEKFIESGFSCKGDMADTLAHSWAELNKIHPFRDGNGRSQYVFFAMSCETKNYNLEASKQDLKNFRTARDLASMGNETILKSLIRRSLVNRSDDNTERIIFGQDYVLSDDLDFEKI